MTAGMDLVEFLRARLDERAAVQLIHSDNCYPGPGDDDVMVCHCYSSDEEKLIRAEVAAQRAVIDWCVAEGRWYLGPVMHLAAVYADHPDYREEWRP